MFDRRDRNGQNPYIISWNSFIDCTLEYEKNGDRHKLNKFFTERGPATKYVVVYTHPKKIAPDGAVIVQATAVATAIETAAGIGLNIRMLLSAPEEMVFATDDEHIVDNLHILKMCLPS